MKVILFPTCLVDALFPSVGIATVRILEKLGIQVVFKEEGICCGQLAFNDGFFEEAKEVARKLIDAMDEDLPVVSPSGSCISMIKLHYGELFRGDPYEEKAKNLIRRSYELTDFLVNYIGVSDIGARFEAKVTYHDACHTKGTLNIHREPRELLRHVKGLELVEMENPDLCCGFGGIFSLKMPSLSSLMLDEKMKNIEKTGAQYVTSTDISCLMHIGGGLLKKGSSVKFIHIAEILANG